MRTITSYISEKVDQLPDMRRSILHAHQAYNAYKVQMHFFNENIYHLLMPCSDISANWFTCRAEFLSDM